MTQLKTVKECSVRDVASDYLESLAPEERVPKLKATQSGPSLKDATEEERAFVRKMGL